MSHRVTIDWMGSEVTTLADLLPSPAKALVVGVNPAPSSVELGHYYQGQLGQRLWQRLHRCGLISADVAGWEDDAAVAAGLGFTDVVKRPTRAAADVSAGERSLGAELLRQKVEAVRPAALIFTFKDAARAVLGRVDGHGWIDGVTVAGSMVFVMPGPYESRERVDLGLRRLAERLS